MAELITRFLGEISPTLDFQYYPVSSTGSESYRLNFSGNLSNYREAILLEARLRDNSIAGYRRFFPSPSPRIFEFRLPELLQNQAVNGLIWGVRRNQTRRTQQLGPSPIFVSLEEITGLED